MGEGPQEIGAKLCSLPEVFLCGEKKQLAHTMGHIHVTPGQPGRAVMGNTSLGAYSSA